MQRLATIMCAGVFLIWMSCMVRYVASGGLFAVPEGLHVLMLSALGIASGGQLVKRARNGGSSGE